MMNSKTPSIDPRHRAALKHIEHSLDYTFRQPALLRQALTHRSYATQNNERFEFVGDAILNYTVARMLFDAFPKLNEGELSRLRANLVNQEVLADIAQSMHLGDALFLGQGELKSGGFNRPSILADAVEALFAAISFDTDFECAEHTVRRLFAGRVRSASLDGGGKDAKTRLQEMLQAQRLPLPKYRIEAQSGQAHDIQFTVSCDLGELGHITRATAASRKVAEQECAKQALVWLEAQLRPRKPGGKRRPKP